MDNRNMNNILRCQMCGSQVRYRLVRSTVMAITDEEYPLERVRTCTNQRCPSNDRNAVRSVTDEV